MEIYAGVLIVAGLIVFSRWAERKQRSAAQRNGEPHGEAVPPGRPVRSPEAKAPPEQEKQKAPDMKTPSSPAGFVSMEDKAPKTRWHPTEMTGEGTDPCHEDMYEAPVHRPEEKDRGTEEAREWARAVVMAEILKRPSERRGRMHAGK